MKMCPKMNLTHQQIQILAEIRQISHDLENHPDYLKYKEIMKPTKPEVTLSEHTEIPDIQIKPYTWTPKDLQIPHNDEQDFFRLLNYNAHFESLTILNS
jgi:hypothetical protein